MKDTNQVDKNNMQNGEMERGRQAANRLHEESVLLQA